MFRRPGKQIMVLAIVFFIIGCILSVVGALSMALTGIGSIMSELSYGYGFSSATIVGQIVGIVLACVAILLGGLVASWLSGLFLYAFGKLVDGADLAATYGEQIFDLLNDVYPADAAPAQNHAKTPSANANTDPFA